VDVLRQLTQGLSNADIAASLVLSPKTVDHHVSSILRKLRVPDRAAAAEAAAVLLKDRESGDRR
jgi:DNA-binding NarL/FixJ family response regulator